MSAQARQAIKAPSATLLAMEAARGAIEHAAGFMLQGHLVRTCPAGDGHPVIVYPGLGTTDGATARLRDFLCGLGYDAQPWNRGLNRGPSQAFDFFLAELLADVRALYRKSGMPVSLVGWSLGGVYARELGKKAPGLIRCVVTLGTPFAGVSGATNGEALFELLSGSKCQRDPALLARLAVTPPVHTTSIYSKTDGVVAWECSVNPEGPLTANHEVQGSHLGLIANPQVFRLLAARLAEPDVATERPSAKIVHIDPRPRVQVRKMRA